MHTCNYFKGRKTKSSETNAKRGNAVREVVRWQELDCCIEGADVILNDLSPSYVKAHLARCSSAPVVIK